MRLDAERVDKREPAIGEVCDVTGGKRQTVGESRGGDEHVGSTPSGALRREASPKDASPADDLRGV